MVKSIAVVSLLSLIYSSHGLQKIKQFSFINPSVIEIQREKIVDDRQTSDLSASELKLFGLLGVLKCSFGILERNSAYTLYEVRGECKSLMSCPEPNKVQMECIPFFSKIHASISKYLNRNHYGCISACRRNCNNSYDEALSNERDVVNELLDLCKELLRDIDIDHDTNCDINTLINICTELNKIEDGCYLSEALGLSWEKLEGKTSHEILNSVKEFN